MTTISRHSTEKRLFENVFNEESKMNNYHYFTKVIFGYKYFAAVLNTSL